MGFLDRFRRSRMMLEVTASPRILTPGESVEVELVVSGTIDPLVEKIEYGLRGLNGFALPLSNDSLNRSGERLHREVREIPTALGTFTASFQIPPDAAPSARGDVYEYVAWAAFALGARAGRDVRSDVPLTVLGGPETCAAREQLAPLVRQASDVADLTFDVPRRVRTGDELRGAIVLSARQNLSVKTIELELRYTEVTPSTPQEVPDPTLRVGDEPPGAKRDSHRGFSRAASGNAEEADVELAAGEEHAFPFAFRIPDGAPPCLVARRSRINWTLRAKADVRGADGPEQELELNVFSAAPPG